ncbi:YdaS family helix-turn-helix protein [Luteibacter sp. PPL552]
MGRSAAISALHAPASNPALDAACQKVGSPAKLAEAIGASLHAVVSWLGGAAIPPDICPTIEQATGSTCDGLRPDLLWVRDANGEILAYAVPVDGADSAYVRQALRKPAPDVEAPAEKRADTLWDANTLSVRGDERGDVSVTIDFGLRRATVVLDPSEATKVASSILALAGSQSASAPGIGTLDTLTSAALDAVRAIRSVKDHFVRGRIVPGPDALEGWNPWDESGPIGRLSKVAADLEQATGDMLVSVPHRPNPLHATAMRETDELRTDHMTNVNWLPAGKTTVDACLNEAALLLTSAKQIILSESYVDSEDAMSLLLGMALSSVSAAHSKLIHFAGDGRFS